MYAIVALLYLFIQNGNLYYVHSCILLKLYIYVIRFLRIIAKCILDYVFGVVLKLRNYFLIYPWNDNYHLVVYMFFPKFRV